MERLAHGRRCRAAEIIKDEPDHQIWRDEHGVLKGRRVVTDPKRQAELFPPPSIEVLAKIQALDRARRDALWRMRSYRFR